MKPFAIGGRMPRVEIATDINPSQTHDRWFSLIPLATSDPISLPFVRS